MKRMSVAFAALAGLAITAGAAEARDQIHIVGSSTVFPFTTAVAENFGKAGKFKTPVVESTGTGGGMKLFCSGVGEDTPDITGASRKIKDSEIEGCGKAGVTKITEILIGYDGIAFANSKSGPAVNVTRKQLYQALAKQVPVDSTTGVLNLPALPKFSATAVVKGNTVEEPTIWIWSRASAAPAVIASPARAARATDMRFIASPSGLI